MTAQDYTINFPYGATEAPYSATRPHKGDDRPCAMRTPVVINGQTIAYTGDTGLTFGPHLHIQEWRGDVLRTRKPQNSFMGGVVVGRGKASEWGNFVTVANEDGWNTTYCHLDEICVEVGQLIGGDMTTEEATLLLDELFWAGLGRKIKQSELDEYVPMVLNKEFKPLLNKFFKFGEVATYLSVVNPQAQQHLRNETLLQSKVEELSKALSTYQMAAGDVEATLIGKALIKVFQTFGYKK